MHCHIQVWLKSASVSTTSHHFARQSLRPSHNQCRNMPLQCRIGADSVLVHFIGCHCNVHNTKRIGSQAYKSHQNVPRLLHLHITLIIYPSKMIQNAQTLIEIIKVFIFKKPCLRLQSFFRWGVGHVDRTTVLPRPSELVSLHGGHTEVTKSSHSWCWNLNFCAVLSTWHQTYNRIYLYFQVKSGSGLEMSIHWQRGRILMVIVFIHNRTFIYLQKSPFDFSNAKKKA